MYPYDTLSQPATLVCLAEGHQCHVNIPNNAVLLRIRTYVVRIVPDYRRTSAMVGDFVSIINLSIFIRSPWPWSSDEILYGSNCPP